MQGKVYLIGAGPGDPGLFTLKGLRCLREADVIIYDHLAAAGLLIFANPKAELIYAGKEAGAHTIPQNDINLLLVSKAREGHVVARLKGGDPYVFGRGGEEGLALAAANIPFEVVPGVSSAIAGPMYAGIPVTHRGLAASVTIITGHEDPNKTAPGHNWRALAQSEGTLVLLMAMQNLKTITQTLLKNGKDAQTPAAVIQNATTARQRTLITTLENLPHDVASQNFTAPAIVVIGPMVKLANELDWFTKLPLFGQKILLTRQGNQALEMAETLSALGAECLHLPVIETAALPKEPLKAAIDNLDAYQWLLFTSKNAVNFFCETLFAMQLDARALHHLKIAAVGAITAQELKRYGITADVTPKQFVAESLLEAMSAADINGTRILLPRAKEARELLPQGLSEKGAIVDVVTIYETLPAQCAIKDWRWLNDTDIITFTSASTVNALKALLPKETFAVFTQNAIAACIGPVTAEAAQKAGFTRVITAKTYTASGLCEIIINEVSK